MGTPIVAADVLWDVGAAAKCRSPSRKAVNVALRSSETPVKSGD
jgi:hypothetical protein